MTLTSFANNSVDVYMDNIVFNVSSLPPPTHHLIAKDQMIWWAGAYGYKKTNNKLINY
jgi:hypothetical protein